MPGTAPIVYRIDKRAEIVFVSDTWDVFAHENESAGAGSNAVLHRSLWSFVGDASLRRLYHQIVERARQGATLRFCYRCDSPGMRRWFDMRVALVEDGLVEFCSTLVKEEERCVEPLLDVHQERSELKLKTCSICLKLRVNDRWLSLEEALTEADFLTEDVLPELRHEVCRTCFETLYETIVGLKRKA